jgi:hypothetical protein
MSVQADIYVSRDDEEAIRYNSEPATFKDREQYTSFTELELSTLWAKVRGIEWDVNSLDEFHTVLVQDGGERIIKRLPKPMTIELARLTPEQISVLLPPSGQPQTRWPVKRLMCSQLLKDSCAWPRRPLRLAGTSISGIAFEGTEFLPVRYKSDTTGPFAGVPYDGMQTIGDGKGKWWEGMDPQMLNGKPHAKNTPCPEFVQQFLLRVQDVIDSSGVFMPPLCLC